MALSKIINGGVAASGIPSGGVIQVQRTQLTTSSTVPVSALTDTVLTGFTVNITPTSTSSIIKLEAMWVGEMDDSPNVLGHMFFFYRDTTKLANTNTSSNKLHGVAPATRTFFNSDTNSTLETAYLSYFDSPSTTSQITYKLGIITQGADTININRTEVDADNNNHENGTSFICATEIAG